MLKNAMRLLLATLLLVVTGYCLFGFLATMEPGVGNVVAWRAVYGGAGVGAFVTALRLTWLAVPLLRSQEF